MAYCRSSKGSHTYLKSYAYSDPHCFGNCLAQAVWRWSLSWTIPHAEQWLTGNFTDSHLSVVKNQCVDLFNVPFGCLCGWAPSSFFASDSCWATSEHVNSLIDASQWKNTVTTLCWYSAMNSQISDTLISETLFSGACGKRPVMTTLRSVRKLNGKGQDSVLHIQQWGQWWKNEHSEDTFRHSLLLKIWKVHYNLENIYTSWMSFLRTGLDVHVLQT
jgi:hypothetical protein